jgi:hypothetical protein
VRDGDQPIIVPPIGAGSAMPPPPPPASSRRRRLVVVAIVVIGALVGAAVAIVVTLGPSGPPEAPGDVRATATTCAPPKCERIAVSATITWSAPSTGSPVTGYAILRDGRALPSTIAAATKHYEDATINLGQQYEYRVVAHSGHGDSPASARAIAKGPLPPLDDAQLTGPYHVKLTLQSSSNIDEVEGIKNPSPGDTRSETWVFAISCAADTGACPTAWNSRKPPLRPRGLTYSGSVRSVSALCGSGSSADKAPSYAIMRLTVTRASELGNSWTVASFVGTYTVSFSCPGGLASVGRFTVRGSSSG